MRYKENVDNLPAPLWNLLKFDEYTRGESKFSVTDLIKPPQIVQLTRRYDDQMEVDPRDNIYRVLGSSVHATLEQVGLQNPEDSQMIEERLHATIEGVSISGQIDLHTTFEDGILTDWKHTKVSVVKFDTKDEWVKQLNCYAHLMRKHGYVVTSARVCSIFRDWSQSGMGGLWKVSTNDGVHITCRKTPDYPDWGVAIIPIPLWPDQEVEEYLTERIRVQEEAAQLSDEELPECTPDDRWRRDNFRVRKTGFVKAKGNKARIKTEAEAKEYLVKMGSEYEMSLQPGIPYRCVFYCFAAPFCQQLKREGFQVQWVVEDKADESEEE